MQLCAEAGAVVTTGSGGVRVGDTVTTGGFPAVHPLTIIKPAMTSRSMKNKPEVFRAMVPDTMLYMIIILGNCGSGETGMNLYVHTRRMKIVLYTMHPRNFVLPQNAITPVQIIRYHRDKRRGGKGGQALSAPSFYLCF